MAISLTSPPPTLNMVKQRSITRPQAKNPRRLSGREIQPMARSRDSFAQPPANKSDPAALRPQAANVPQ